MHYREYQHYIYFILCMYHKSLEWLVTMSDAHGRRGCLVNMLQDFSFKIIHMVGSKHPNVDTLSRNLVGMPKEDEGDDFLCSRKGRKMERDEMC